MFLIEILIEILVQTFFNLINEFFHLFIVNFQVGEEQQN